MKAGDRLLDGSLLQSTKCAGRQGGVFYTSPTIRYAGTILQISVKGAYSFTVYCKAQVLCGTSQSGLRDGSINCDAVPAASMVILVTGGNHGISEDMAGSSGEHMPICQLSYLAAIEWKSEVNPAAIPYGVLVQIYAVDDNSQDYSTAAQWTDADPV